MLDIHGRWFGVNFQENILKPELSRKNKWWWKAHKKNLKSKNEESRTGALAWEELPSHGKRGATGGARRLLQPGEIVGE